MVKCKSFGSYLRIFLIICLLALSVLQSILALMKHLEGKTTYHITLQVRTFLTNILIEYKNSICVYQEVSKVQYPSVSVCKKYTFDNYIDHMFKSDSELTLDEVIDNARNNSWDIERLFYFFTHPGMLGLSFPCTTILGGTSPGKPCIFPIRLDDEVTYTECYLLETPSPACITKVDDKGYGSAYEHSFGYCHQNCSGERIEPGSNYNLAKGGFI